MCGNSSEARAVEMQNQTDGEKYGYNGNVLIVNIIVNFCDKRYPIVLCSHWSIWLNAPSAIHILGGSNFSHHRTPL